MNAIKGEIDKALSYLERAIEIGGEIYIRYAKEDRDDIFKRISDDPRFIRLLSEADVES